MYNLCIVDGVTIWVLFAFSCVANSGGFAWIRVFTNQRTAVDNGDQTFKGIHEEHGGLELGVSYHFNIVLSFISEWDALWLVACA